MFCYIEEFFSVSNSRQVHWQKWNHKNNIWVLFEERLGLLLFKINTKSNYFRNFWSANVLWHHGWPSLCFSLYGQWKCERNNSYIACIGDLKIFYWGKKIEFKNSCLVAVSSNFCFKKASFAYWFPLRQLRAMTADLA